MPMELQPIRLGLKFVGVSECLEGKARRLLWPQSVLDTQRCHMSSKLRAACYTIQNVGIWVLAWRRSCLDLGSLSQIGTRGHADAEMEWTGRRGS
jgi:hypothetical protein